MSIPKLITHACGSIDGISYTNAKEALEYSYHTKNSKYIEIDINLSRDEKYVLIHDWHKTFTTLFGYKADAPLTLVEFKQLKIQDKFTTLSLDDFLAFMHQNHDLHLISDVKAGGNEAFYNYIKVHHNELLKRIYIQCYNESEYEDIKNSGFNNLIYGLYKEADIDFDNLDNFIKQHNISYVSINKPRIHSDFILSLKKNNVSILTHTVNDEDELNMLTAKGIDCVFTDKLYL
ncbi:MAG: hypothetical protein HON23_05480 [Rickettsiales bacterium]|jgi:glycerophosphoryl diester phosphodiesterase|nr:hypothetical protein [Rickettsiales bacterium]